MHHGNGGEDDPVKERENPGEAGENGKLLSLGSLNSEAGMSDILRWQSRCVGLKSRVLHPGE